MVGRAVAVGADVIGAQRVDGDEQDVEVGGHARRHGGEGGSSARGACEGAVAADAVLVDAVVGPSGAPGWTSASPSSQSPPPSTARVAVAVEVPGGVQPLQQGARRARRGRRPPSARGRRGRPGARRARARPASPAPARRAARRPPRRGGAHRTTSPPAARPAAPTRPPPPRAAAAPGERPRRDSRPPLAHATAPAGSAAPTRAAPRPRAPARQPRRREAHPQVGRDRRARHQQRRRQRHVGARTAGAMARLLHRSSDRSPPRRRPSPSPTRPPAARATPPPARRSRGPTGARARTGPPARTRHQRQRAERRRLRAHSAAISIGLWKAAVQKGSPAAPPARTAPGRQLPQRVGHPGRPRSAATISPAPGSERPPRFEPGAVDPRRPRPVVARTRCATAPRGR